jgi:hypothetical protein
VSLHIVNVDIFRSGRSVEKHVSERTFKVMESFTSPHLISAEMFNVFTKHSKKLRKIEFGGWKRDCSGEDNPFRDFLKMNPSIISIKLGQHKGFSVTSKDLQNVMNHCLNLESFVCESYTSSTPNQTLLEFIIQRKNSLKYCNVNNSGFRLMTSENVFSVRVTTLDERNPLAILDVSGLSRIVKAFPTISMVQYVDKNRTVLSAECMNSMKDMLSACPHVSHLKVSMDFANLDTLLSGPNNITQLSYMFCDSLENVTRHSMQTKNINISVVTSVISESEQLL